MTTRQNGFTLIELLVVVLIIGILAAVAMPQYTKAVEKVRITEALSNIKIIQDNYFEYQLAHGAARRNTTLKDVLVSADLTGGEWAGDKNYQTKKYEYYFYCGTNGDCSIDIYSLDYSYSLYIHWEGTNVARRWCWTNETDKGRRICKSMESQGWEYTDAEL